MQWLFQYLWAWSPLVSDPSEWFICGGDSERPIMNSLFYRRHGGYVSRLNNQFSQYCSVYLYHLQLLDIPHHLASKQPQHETTLKQCPSPWHTSYLSFLSHRQDCQISNFTPQKNLKMSLNICSSCAQSGKFNTWQKKLHGARDKYQVCTKPQTMFEIRITYFMDHKALHTFTLQTKAHPSVAV